MPTIQMLFAKKHNFTTDHELPSSKIYSRGDYMKKIISIILAVILIFSVNAASFSSYATGKCGCSHTPIVYVTGFAMTDLVANPGTDEQYNVFVPENKAIISAVARLIAPAVMLRLTGDYESFAGSLSRILNDTLRDVACDDSGEPLNETVDVSFRVDPIADHADGMNNRFNYDWREDIFDIAAELNDYIEKTKKLTRHDKVVLKGESMGGAVVMTYLSRYGSGSVDTVIMQSSAFNGITLVGGLFTGDINIKTQSVMNYIGNFIEGSDPATVFCRSLFYALSGFLLSPVCGELDSVFTNGKEVLYEECLRDLFGNLTGVWTFVPNEYYEQAKAYMLDETENAALIKKLDAYHYGVMDRTKEILDRAIANGMKLAIISNYGKAAVPVLKNDGYQSDFLIDTARTSLGATCADFSTTLGEGYTQSVADGHDHISCDNAVDASTCLYPEYTWFIKDMMHTWYTSGYKDFTLWLAWFGRQPTVHDSADYPQFLYNDQVNKALVPLTLENSDTQKTITIC